MKTIFFISSIGFPSKINKNVGIFTLEQAKAAEKENYPILIDLATNKTGKIYSDKIDGLIIYRILYSKYNPVKIIKNFFFFKRVNS